MNSEAYRKGMNCAESFYTQAKVIRDVKHELAGDRYRIKLEARLAELDLDSKEYEEVLALYDSLVDTL